MKIVKYLFYRLILLLLTIICIPFSHISDIEYETNV